MERITLHLYGCSLSSTTRINLQADACCRLIEPFQRGETPTFIEHIKAGLTELAANENAILVFSGGDTKPSKTSRIEATSYHALLVANKLFGHTSSLARRISTDIYATDSFQNVLFPLLTFGLHAAQPFVGDHSAFEATASLLTKSSGPAPRTLEVVPPKALYIPTGAGQPCPRHLTIIGHEFKRRRFEELHLPAVGWPVNGSAFKYIGIDPPMDAAKRSEVLAGEMSKGLGAWQQDLYGTRKALVGKRTARGWSEDKAKAVETLVSEAWGSSEFKDDVLKLLAWNGGGSGVEQYPGVLPWRFTH